MKRKIFVYSFLPVLGIAGILGANIASAHGLFGGFGNVSPDQIAVRQQSMFQNEAQILGISIDEVKNAWAEGKTLEDIMKTKGITAEQVQAKMKEFRLQQMKSQLQVFVDKGIITQAQADKRLQFMQNRVESSKGRIGKLSRGFNF